MESAELELLKVVQRSVERIENKLEAFQSKTHDRLEALETWRAKVFGGVVVLSTVVTMLGSIGYNEVASIMRSRSAPTPIASVRS